MNRNHKYRTGIMGAIAPAIAMLLCDPPDRQPNQDPNQQQQQQQQNGNTDPNNDGFVSPFANIDRDLLDDTTRQSIERAEQQMRTMHGQVQSVSTMQSQLDLTRNELQRLQNSQQQPPQHQQQQQPQSFKDKMVQTYIARGIDPKVAKELADMNHELFDEFGQLVQKEMGQQFAPLAQQVFDTNARDAFAQAQNMDALGAFQHPEIAQYVWDRVQQHVQNGHLATPELCQNFAYIAYGKAIAEGKIQPTPPQNTDPQFQQPIIQRQQFPPVNPQNQQTRLTYPGAGHHTQRPPVNNPTSARPIDPDTDAAMAATVSNWDVKPKAYRPNGNKAPSVITRGN